VASNSEYVVNIHEGTKDMFVTLTDDYVINFGKNNLLNTGGCLDSFALFKALNCDGDHIRAYIEGGKNLGISTDGVDILDIIQMAKKHNIELHAKTKNFIDDGSMRGAFFKYAHTVLDLSLDFWIEKYGIESFLGDISLQDKIMNVFSKDGEVQDSNQEQDQVSIQEKTYAIFNAIEPELKKAISEALL
jgi:hypothetical protein